MITYLAKFIPACSEITAPLRELLKKNVTFSWDFTQTEAFDKIKKILASPPVLGYYDVNLPVKLTVDASSKALGAVLLQKGHPIAYSSRALTETEKKYPQIEKEALAIRFACKRFHQYIYGRSLTIETDHKPLEVIFKKKLQAAPARLQRIILEVYPYNPEIIYCKGKDIPIADLLSRDVQNNNEETSSEEELEIDIIMPMSTAALNSLVHDTESDENLSVLKKYILNGFPEDRKIPNGLMHFQKFEEELSTYDGIIFKGEKIIIPNNQISKILNATHMGHIGIQSTLRRTRQLFYWQTLTRDVTEYVEKCSVCQSTQRSNIKQPAILKEIPIYPFQIVASDIFHFNSDNYILLVDSNSGFIEIEKLKFNNSFEVVRFLKKNFAIFGTPEILESDNGPQYSSEEFKKFAEQWQFNHKTSSPHYPRANSLAERAVQTIKSLLKKCEKDKSDVLLALQNLRNTPRNEELGSPNERLMSRITKTTCPISLNLLQPKIIHNVNDNITKLRQKGKVYADHGSKSLPELKIDDNIRMQIAHRKWIGGKVAKELEQPRSVIVRSDEGKFYRRNYHHLHKTIAKFPIKKEIETNIELNDTQARRENENQANTTVITEPISRTGATAESTTRQIKPRRTRYGRIIKPVGKLDL